MACRKTTTYPSKDAAKKSERYLRKRGHGIQDIYHCNEHHGWHLGHPSGARWLRAGRISHRGSSR